MHRGKSKKRPCRICRKWYYPDPRVGERQKTCGDKDCQDKWHAKKCAEWNNKNPAYFREIYLSKKLDVVKVKTKSGDHPPPLSNSASSSSNSRDFSALSSAKSVQVPRDLIQEVIGTQALVIIEYMDQLLIYRFQEVMRRQVTEIKREFKQVPREAISRGDGIRRGS